MGYLVAALTVSSFAYAVLGITRRSAMLQRLGIAFAGGCVVSALVLALTRVSAANNAARSQFIPGVSRTSYASGAVLGIVGSVALLVACFVVRSAEWAANEPAAPMP